MWNFRNWGSLGGEMFQGEIWTPGCLCPRSQAVWTWHNAQVKSRMLHGVCCLGTVTVKECPLLSWVLWLWLLRTWILIDFSCGDAWSFWSRSIRNCSAETFLGPPVPPVPISSLGALGRSCSGLKPTDSVSVAVLFLFTCDLSSSQI